LELTRTLTEYKLFNSFPDLRHPWSPGELPKCKSGVCIVEVPNPFDETRLRLSSRRRVGVGLPGDFVAERFEKLGRLLLNVERRMV